MESFNLGPRMVNRSRGPVCRSGEAEEVEEEETPETRRQLLLLNDASHSRDAYVPPAEARNIGAKAPQSKGYLPGIADISAAKREVAQSCAPGRPPRTTRHPGVSRDPWF